MWRPAQTRWLIPPLLHFSRSPPFPQPRSNTHTCCDPAPRTCSRISPVKITNNQSKASQITQLLPNVLITFVIYKWSTSTDVQTDLELGSHTNQNALQPVVEVPHEEDSASTSSSQTDLLQAVVVTRHFHAVITSPLIDQWYVINNPCIINKLIIIWWWKSVSKCTTFLGGPSSSSFNAIAFLFGSMIHTENWSLRHYWPGSDFKPIKYKRGRG